MKITIETTGNNYWSVTKRTSDGKRYAVEDLTWDEMLGCVASATMPVRDREHPGYYLQPLHKPADPQPDTNQLDAAPNS